MLTGTVPVDDSDDDSFVGVVVMGREYERAETPASGEERHERMNALSVEGG